MAIEAATARDYEREVSVPDTNIALNDGSHVCRDAGAAMVEYGLLITGIALVVAVFVVAFGGDVAGLFNIDLGG